MFNFVARLMRIRLHCNVDPVARMHVEPRVPPQLVGTHQTDANNGRVTFNPCRATYVWYMQIG